MIDTLVFYIRLLAIGAALLLIAQLVAGEIRAKIKVPVVLMVVGAVGYLLNSTPLEGSAGALDPWIDLVSISVPFWIWLFARNLFEREPAPRLILIIAAGLLAAWSANHFLNFMGTAGFYIVHVIELGLIADLVRVAFVDREDDLVEERRVIRLWLPLLVAAQAGAVLIAELIFAPNAPPGEMQLFNAVMIFALIQFAGLSLLRTEPTLLIDTAGDRAAKKPVENSLDLTPSQTALHERLTAVMADGAYRTPGLTIAALADQLDTPEHRLRALINRQLGYRNFSAFLNQHRIAEARERLVEKDNIDVPILTIAMDLGYNSLATFNRAFRSEAGTTPSEFRRLGLAPIASANADQN